MHPHQRGSTSVVDGQTRFLSRKFSAPSPPFEPNQGRSCSGIDFSLLSLLSLPYSHEHGGRVVNVAVNVNNQVSSTV